MTRNGILSPQGLSREEDVDFENGLMISARISLCKT